MGRFDIAYEFQKGKTDLCIMDGFVVWQSVWWLVTFMVDWMVVMLIRQLK